MYFIPHQNSPILCRFTKHVVLIKARGECFLSSSPSSTSWHHSSFFFATPLKELLKPYFHLLMASEMWKPVQVLAMVMQSHHLHRRVQNKMFSANLVKYLKSELCIGTLNVALLVVLTKMNSTLDLLELYTWFASLSYYRKRRRKISILSTVWCPSSSKVVLIITKFRKEKSH